MGVSRLRTARWPGPIVDLAESLTIATSRPAQVAGLSGGHGRLAPEGPADFVHLTDDLHLNAVWQSGAQLE